MFNEEFIGIKDRGHRKKIINGIFFNFYKCTKIHGNSESFLHFTVFICLVSMNRRSIKKLSVLTLNGIDAILNNVYTFMSTWNWTDGKLAGRETFVYVKSESIIKNDEPG